MTHIKKDYVELVAFLEANSGKKVSAILDELKGMCSAKTTMKSTVRRDSEGNVTHVYCYYHKKWEDITVAEYGKKSKTASGLNTMCKEGTNCWTKQQRIYKAKMAEIADAMLDGKMSPEEAREAKAEAEAAKDIIVPRSDEHGSDE
jgi:hypothetical protein